MRKAINVGLSVLVVLALLYLVWTFTVGEPISNWLAGRSQAQLREEYEEQVAAFELQVGHLELGRPEPNRHFIPPPAPEEGKPFGRIVIHAGDRMNVDVIVVQGTEEEDLNRGPGHYDRARYPESDMPGAGDGAVIPIAGHRTTWGAWFRHIDSLKPGDEIRLYMPYGRFTYRVTGHRVVDDEDLSYLDARIGETVVLSACHPLGSAEKRWVVFAQLEERRLTT